MPQRYANLETRLREEIGPTITVDNDGDRIALSGTVSSQDDRILALELAAEEFPDTPIEDAISVETDGVAESLGEIGAVRLVDDADDGLIEGEVSLEAGDFMTRDNTTDALGASGGNASLEDDIAESGDVVYSPPTDPVGTNTEIIGGLQSDSMESIEVDRSALDGQLGDEAIADAVRRELREDAATTDLAVEVEVDAGAVRLTGTVAYLVDAENAEEVAGRVPGVLEVLEDLDVEALDTADI